ncbi:DNA-directed DNA polymerase II small subunit [Natrialba swarupiae]|uniref:DNA polymerase II small subunit n=1 Tax=Natrialba swarupiae TaxID=2448032 RepID=A0A5D5APU6_9EURY|nr:DNA-directed DNA polymerase II small subunit [Natrialba swarupiae]TYT63716.1 DNA-directed DNA polymerase II small subunit [Natrialba swarupiae]
MPLEGAARIVDELTSRGYNAEREAVTLIASAENPAAVLERVVEDVAEDALVVRTDHVETALSAESSSNDSVPQSADPVGEHPSVSTGDNSTSVNDSGTQSPGETKGSPPPDDRSRPATDQASTAVDSPRSTSDVDRSSTGNRSADPELRSLEIDGDMTGESTGTGEYDDFVAVFRDRLERLGSKLKGRVNHRPATAIQSMPGGSEAGMVGLVNDVRSTASGHWLIELEDATGTFPWLVMKDREYADLVEELLCDEVLAMEGTLSDDAGIAFVDSMYFPDVPRTREPSTADRHVQAALISDVHVGSEEFMEDAWNAFADWLYTEEADHVEYLLIAGDMVEGVGVYPNQDEELEIVDIYEQYETFNEHLKSVPGDIEIVMIPGNHDAVRLAEPQPGFDENLRNIMSAHDARIVSNPSTVTLEGVSVLMYHGVSLDEVIAELPEEKASYDDPHKAMYHLLKKRHVAPQFGGHTRLAPEERDYLVIEDVPDIFHTGHVHKLGFGKYHNVLAINSGCWQAQTDFQKSVNIDPDAGYAPIVDLDTLDVTVQKFS